MIPTEATSADLARAIGVTERRVGTVKAEGRLPVTRAGKIDLASLLRLGWNAALAARGSAPGGQSRSSKQAFDAGMRVAASVAARCALSAILAPLPGEDAEAAAARGLYVAVSMLEIALDPEMARVERLAPMPMGGLA